LTDAELVRAIVDDGAVFMFKHTLVQETVHGTLLKNENRRLHLLVGQALENVNADRLDDYAAQLAQHFAAAEDDAKTFEYSMRAGDNAKRTYANQEALAHYARATGLAKQGFGSSPQVIHLYEQRGRILEVISRYHDAAACYFELHEIAQTRQDRSLELGYLMLRATVHSSPMPTFDAELAKQLLLDALGTARELSDRVAEARVLWNLCLLSTHTMRPADGLMYGELSLALAQELELREQKALTLHDLFVPYRAVGQIARAREVQSEARALFREMNNLPLLADSLGMGAQFSLYEGAPEAALAQSAEGSALSRMVGNVFGVDFNQGFIAAVHLERGEYSETLQAIEDQLAAIRRGATPVNGLWLAALVSYHLGAIGALEVSLELEEKARAMKRLPVPPIFVTGWSALLTRIRLIHGDIAGAGEEFEGIRPESNLQEALSPGAIYAPFAEAELKLAQQDFRGALAALAPQAEWARANAYVLILIENLLLQGRSHYALGEQELASRALAPAAGLAQGMEGRRLLWQILALSSEVEAERGNFELAEDYRKQARELVEYIAAHIPVELRAGFLNLPRVRALELGV
jgi:hypothetical protein